MQHTASQFSLTNRHALKITGDLSLPELPPNTQPKSLLFLQHGLGGFRTQSHMLAVANAFLANGYAVFNFDATNSTGESEGKYEDATMSGHYDDLVDVIEWARSQPWFISPFVLAGHSLGGYAVARYAEDRPEEVKAVFPFANVVSGELTHEANKRFKPEKYEDWKATGWFTRISNSKPGLELRLPWSHMEERLEHDLMKNIDKLTMPVLLIVGTEDDSIPPDHQQIFFDALPDNTNPPKELHIIDGMPHTPRKPEHLAQVTEIIDAWIKKLG